MFPALLLMSASLAALTASILIGRANSGVYDSPLLQRENWAGYVLLSIGLAVAAVYRFLEFSRQYGFEQNHRLGLDYFGIDLSQPIPIIYGALALGAICYLVWRHRKRRFEGTRDKKRIASEVAVLAVMTAIVTFGCFVWPTPWTAWESRTEPADSSSYGIWPGPWRDDNGHLITQFRTNRITGEWQLKTGGHWEHEPERM